MNSLIPRKLAVTTSISKPNLTRRTVCDVFRRVSDSFACLGLRSEEGSIRPLPHGDQLNWASNSLDAILGPLWSRPWAITRQITEGPAHTQRPALLKPLFASTVRPRGHYSHNVWKIRAQCKRIVWPVLRQVLSNKSGSSGKVRLKSTIQNLPVTLSYCFKRIVVESFPRKELVNIVQSGMTGSRSAFALAVGRFATKPHRQT